MSTITNNWQYDSSITERAVKHIQDTGVDGTYRESNKRELNPVIEAIFTRALKARLAQEWANRMKARQISTQNLGDPDLEAKTKKANKFSIDEFRPEPVNAEFFEQLTNAFSPKFIKSVEKQLAALRVRNEAPAQSASTSPVSSVAAPAAAAAPPTLSSSFAFVPAAIPAQNERVMIGSQAFDKWVIDEAVAFLQEQANPGAEFTHEKLLVNEALKAIRKKAIDVLDTMDATREYFDELVKTDSTVRVFDSVEKAENEYPNGIPKDLFGKIVDDLEAQRAPEPRESNPRPLAERRPVSWSRMRISPLKVILGVTLGLAVIAAIAGAILFAPPVAAAVGLAGAALLAAQISLIAGGGIVALIALGVLAAKSRPQPDNYDDLTDA